MITKHSSNGRTDMAHNKTNLNKNQITDMGTLGIPRFYYMIEQFIHMANKFLSLKVYSMANKDKGICSNTARYFLLRISHQYILSSCDTKHNVTLINTHKAHCAVSGMTAIYVKPGFFTFISHK